MSARLIFVYNVDAHPMALLRDLWQGLRTGQTDCHLCDISYGRLLKDRGWKRFVDSLPLEVDFLLRSTFRARFPHAKGPFPAAYIEREGELEEAIRAEEMNALEDVHALRARVERLIAGLEIP